MINRLLTIIIFLSGILTSCKNGNDISTNGEIPVFKGLCLNSNINAVPFSEDIQIKSVDDNIKLERAVLAKYNYDKLFDKYRVNYLDIGVFKNKIWHINVELEIPYAGTDNDKFKDLFREKYGEPDSIYNENWCHYWNKGEYSVEIYPLSKRSSITEYGDTTNSPAREVTEWIIHYKANDLHKIRRTYRDSIKQQEDQKKLREI